MEIYFDNSATTKTAECVNEKMLEVLNEAWGNPSSLHKIGMNAEKYLKKSARIIADEIGANADEIYFTSGGTESNNIAIMGYTAANKKRGMHVITTSVEHPAVLECFKKLEQKGFEVDYIAVNENGNISLEELDSLLRKDTILVSVMHINNEIGAIYPIEKIKELIKKKSPNAAFHCDAVQSFCKEKINVKKMGIDMLSMSGHKIHGPKGIGALYVKKGTIISNIVYGGHQQKNLRSGTENVFGAAGMAEAVEYMRKKDSDSVKMVKKVLYEKICENVENVVLNGDLNGSDYILNLSFPGIRSEILLHSLEARGIYVSAGSACSSNKPSPSNTLTKMNKSAKEIDSAIRFSFSRENTVEEAVLVAEAVSVEVLKIRKYTRA